MKLPVKKVNGVETMSSLDMVKYINSTRKDGDPELRHDNFMAKVPAVLGDDAPKFLGTQTYGNNNTRSVYNFPKREASLMAMSYSYTLQAHVFDRWQELEQKEAEHHRELVNRAISRLEFKPMNEALEESRKELGKETAAHHYSNESDMINRIVLGATSKQYRINHGIEKEPIRDHLNDAEIAAIIGLQRANMIYIQDGMAFDERKAKLNSLYMRKFNAAIVEQFERLEA